MVAFTPSWRTRPSSRSSTSPTRATRSRWAPGDRRQVRHRAVRARDLHPRRGRLLRALRRRHRPHRPDGAPEHPPLIRQPTPRRLRLPGSDLRARSRRIPVLLVRGHRLRRRRRLFDGASAVARHRHRRHGRLGGRLLPERADHDRPDHESSLHSRHVDGRGGGSHHDPPERPGGHHLADVRTHDVGRRGPRQPHRHRQRLVPRPRRRRQRIHDLRSRLESRDARVRLERHRDLHPRIRAPAGRRPVLRPVGRDPGGRRGPVARLHHDRRRELRIPRAARRGLLRVRSPADPH